MPLDKNGAEIKEGDQVIVIGNFKRVVVADPTGKGNDVIEVEWLNAGAPVLAYMRANAVDVVESIERGEGLEGVSGAKVKMAQPQAQEIVAVEERSEAVMDASHVLEKE